MKMLFWFFEVQVALPLFLKSIYVFAIEALSAPTAQVALPLFLKKYGVSPFNKN